ncbi:MAG: LacI family transcriptional regulator [Prevotellaceae bacterium]|jgi:LacI family transcriptional regulator|nr:LacI family transcriptional regulator [Prevotellaceae bacterium]
MRSQHVTIKDIANELGFSVSTVSRALKNHPDISEETKRLVNELAEHLRYTPNPIALSLKNRSSSMIGVIVPEVVHYFFATVISGIEDVAERNGYSLMLMQSSEQLSKEVTAVANVMKGRVDGVLASVSKQTNTYEHFQKLMDEHIPLVFFDRVADDVDTTHITVDDFGGAYSATKHLIGQGCKNIVHFAGPQNRKIFRDRLNGYRQALENNGLFFKPELVVAADTLDKGAFETQRLLAQGVVFDAIFAVNDFTAAGAMRALKEAKKAIPQDVALVGFGDESITLMLEPNFSSVHQSGYEMGQKAMEHLLMQIHSEDKLPTEQVVLPAELVIRESSMRLS